VEIVAAGDDVTLDLENVDKNILADRANVEKSKRKIDKNIKMIYRYSP